MFVKVFVYMFILTLLFFIGCSERQGQCLLAISDVSICSGKSMKNNVLEFKIRNTGNLPVWVMEPLLIIGEIVDAEGNYFNLNEYYYFSKNEDPEFPASVLLYKPVDGVSKFVNLDHTFGASGRLALMVKIEVPFVVPNEQLTVRNLDFMAHRIFIDKKRAGKFIEKDRRMNKAPFNDSK